MKRRPRLEVYWMSIACGLIWVQSALAIGWPSPAADVIGQLGGLLGMARRAISAEARWERRLAQAENLIRAGKYDKALRRLDKAHAGSDEIYARTRQLRLFAQTRGNRQRGLEVSKCLAEEAWYGIWGANGSHQLVPPQGTAAWDADVDFHLRGAVDAELLVSMTRIGLDSGAVDAESTRRLVDRLIAEQPHHEAIPSLAAPPEKDSFDATPVLAESYRRLILHVREDRERLSHAALGETRQSRIRPLVSSPPGRLRPKLCSSHLVARQLGMRADPTS